MPVLEKLPAAPAPRRPWYWDALASAAFWGQAMLLGKFFSKVGGPIVGLFAFAFFAGLGWMFGKAARRGLVAGRENSGK